MTPRFICGTALVAIFLASGCGSERDVCEEAAAHLDDCFEEGAAPTVMCTEEYAESVLSRSCDELTSEKADLVDFLCEVFGVFCPDEPIACEHSGQLYQVGESRPDDECPGNTCTCNDFDGEGVWSCTELACAPACEHDGELYFVGDARPDEECPGNLCTCNVFDGEPMWSCTELACAPLCIHDGEEFEIGDTRPGDDCDANVCTCTDAGGIVPEWSCTELGCPDE